MSVTIRFRAKRAEFSGGTGYKVPEIKSSHISFTQRDTRTTLIESTRDPEIRRRQIERVYGIEIPGVVWEEYDPADPFKRDTRAWTITPIGKGFMADVSITAERPATPTHS